MLTRPLLPALAVLALLVAPSAASADPAAGPAAAKKRCTAKNATTVAKNRYARVFTKPSRRADEVERLYGCLYRNGRRVLLDVASDDEYVTSQTYDTVKLNGRFVAWQHSEHDVSCKADCPPGYEPSRVDLRVANLRSRRTKVVDGSLGEGTALVVTRTGAIAWIQPGTPVSVRASDRGGTRVLDEGDDIDGGSLSLSRSTVSWVAGGAAMAAALR